MARRGGAGHALIIGLYEGRGGSVWLTQRGGRGGSGDGLVVWLRRDVGEMG